MLDIGLGAYDAFYLVSSISSGTRVAYLDLLSLPILIDVLCKSSGAK